MSTRDSLIGHPAGGLSSLIGHPAGGLSSLIARGSVIPHGS
ncbi:MAG: hypothetical protein NTV33_06580 [Coprothermobacterota bacterium]|nr:hypothetical protein [Coprothermobacterota bacterium]